MGKLKEEFCRGLRTVVLPCRHLNDEAGDCKLSLKGRGTCSRKYTSQSPFQSAA